MKKTVLLCVLSAAAGAAIVTLWPMHDPTPRAMAQSPLGRPGSSAAAQVATAPVPSGIAADLPAELTPQERVNIAVYESANRSVVNINTRSARPDGFFFFESVPSEGAGSGSVVDRQGHILTNLHVVEDADQIEATLASGNTYPAELIGQDPATDVAILKIDAPAAELIPITLGNSTHLRVGQQVFAIGNPFGLERTLTTGVISSLNRMLPSRQNYRLIKSIIQIDAAMNPGNSGGPLLDSAGRVIGMNTAIASHTGENTGVGFAIPVNRIKTIMADLIRHGRVVRPDLGIVAVLETEEGLLIRSLTPGGPADRAGLKGFRVVERTFRRGGAVYESRRIDRSTADLITAVDGHPVRSADDLLSYVEEKKPGNQLQLTIVREGRQQQVSVTLGQD